MKRQALIHCLWLALLLCPGFSYIQAQNCAGYERELEEYFYNFQPGSTVINIRQVDMVYARCTTPGPKMSLIYYYLKSMDVWYAPYLSDEAAYHDARFYYEKAAAYFPYLVEAPAGESFFVELYFDRAQSLQNQLGIDYIATQPLPTYGNEGARMRGDDEPAPYEFEWKKYTPEHAEVSTNTYRTRGMNGMGSPDPATLRKSDYRDGEYQPVSRGESSSQEINGETYGEVGSISSLSAIEYLRFRKDWEKETQRSMEIAANAGRGDNTATARYAAQQNTTATSYTGLICIYDNAVVRTKPAETATPVGLVRFGEIVARIDEQAPVKSTGNTYLSVRMQDGQIGWIVSHALVKDGRLAVITAPAKGYLSTNPETARDRNMIIFTPGELVVLEGVQGEYIQIVSRDASKRAWVRGIGELSIDALDIQIGQKLYEASRQNSISMRKAILQSIKTMPGFAQSELADDVLQLLATDLSMR